MEGIRVTSDGGLISVGSTDSFADPAGDAWVVKLDAYGDPQWQKTYGGSRDDTLLDVRQTPDGGYVAAGWTKSFGVSHTDGGVIKMSPAGAVQWANTYGGSGTEQFWSIDVTSDGGYVVAGGTTSFGAGREDYWVVKLDPGGDIQWQRAYGGPKDDGDCASAAEPECVVRVIEDLDGNLVVASETRSFAPGISAIWVVKLDPSGNLLWEKAYGGSDEDTMWSFDVAADGGYIVPGSTISFSPDSSGDTWVLKLDRDGNIQWQKVYGVGGHWDESLSVGATADGGALIGSFVEQGSSDWDLLLLRLDSAGAVVWQRTYEYGWDWPNAVRQTPDGGFAVAGVAWPRPGEFDLWTLRLDPNGLVGSSCSSIQPLNLQVGTTGAIPVDTSATVTDTNTVPRSVVVTARETTGTSSTLCQASAGEQCSNGANDDGDTLVDCADPDCQGDTDGDTYVAAPCGPDCDDTDAAVHPGAVEVCTNEKDDECDGHVDCADPDCQTNVDADGDTYFALACGTDCDDADPAVNPGATEVCANTRDDYCDGNADCADAQCVELPVCTVSTAYGRRRSMARFRPGASARDRARTRVCVTQDFCTALSGIAGDASRHVTVTLDGCPPLVVPGDAIRSNASGTTFKAASDSSQSPAYVLRVVCGKLRALVKLRGADLQTCVANPVGITLAASGTPSLHAEATFDEARDGDGALRKLTLTTDRTCAP